MRIVELSLRNYRVFDEVDLELPARVIGIFGPNGAGKSSLLESIRYALYGETRTDKRQVRTHGVLTDAAVRVVFEHGGQQYEIRRTIKGKNHATDAELFVGDAQLAAGVTPVNDEVRRLLRMDQKVFRASVFAEQKQLDAFSDIRAGERKEMVLRLLGIRPVDVARAAARKAMRERKGDAERLLDALPDLAALEAQLDELRAAAEDIRARAAVAAEALAEAEARATQAERAFVEADAVREQVERLTVERDGLAAQAEGHARKEASLSERIRTLEEELAELPGMEEELAGLEGADERLAAARRASETAATIRDLESKLSELPDEDTEAALEALEASQRDLDAARERAARASAAAERAASDLAAAEETLAHASRADPEHPCPTCGRPLGDDFEEYLDHCRASVVGATATLEAARREDQEAGEAVRGVQRAHADAAKRGQAAQVAVQQRSSLEERVGEERQKLQTWLQPFDGEEPDLPALEAAARRQRELEGKVSTLSSGRRHLDQARADLDTEVVELARCRARLEEIDAEVAGLAFDAEAHASLRKEREEAQRLLEQARDEERRIRDELASAERELGTRQGAFEQARESAAQAERLREDARYLGRTTALLDGFRDHLVGRIGPELSREAEALFRELTGAEYDDLKIDDQTLAIQIADGADYFPIERFSGSETDLANLALRVAISKRLSYMSGTDIGMLVLDEVLASLDAERKDLFVRAMGRLSNHFHQLFVITHAEQVKDQFQAVIEVQKLDRRRSRALLA